MKSLKTQLRVIIIFLSAMFLSLTLYFGYAVNTYGGRWFVNPYNPRIQNEKKKVIPGDIFDRNRTVLATSDQSGERMYANDQGLRKSLSHIVGDNYGLSISGAESFMAQYLLGFDANVFERVAQSFSATQRKGSDVMLTVDAQLNDFASSAMGNNRGAIIVLNYKTGEILASVSHPMFDPENMDAYRPASDTEKRNNKDDGDTSALVNRVTMGRYTPGSVFKLITAAAALRFLPGVNEREFDCEGPLAFDKDSGRFLSSVHISPEEDKSNREAEALARKDKAQGKATPTPIPATDSETLVDETTTYKLVRDYNSDYHGALTLKSAFAKSCNGTFARLGMEIGYKHIAQMAAAFGIGEDFMFKDIMVYPSDFPAADSQVNLAWSAIGQYKDIVTPMNIALIAAAIANDGVMMEPKLLKGVINSSNYNVYQFKAKVYRKPLTASEAKLMQEYMLETVKNGTGTAAALSKYKVGGKTGTAEVSSDKSKNPHAWFAGFVQSDSHPIAIAVVLENAGTGGGKAAPVAKKILAKAIELGY